MLASPLGIFLSRYLNKWGYKAALAAILIVNRLTMITTAALDLAKDDINLEEEMELIPPTIVSNMQITIYI